MKVIRGVELSCSMHLQSSDPESIFNSVQVEVRAPVTWKGCWMVKHQAKTPSEEISSDLEGMLLVMHQDSHVLD